MNAEKLHKIAKELKAEFDKINLVTKITELRDNLQNVVNQPQEPTYQHNMVNVQKEIYIYLENVPSNDFGPVWSQMIDEINGSNILGKKLKNRIDQIFQANQITPSNALNELNAILTEIQAFHNALNQLITGFDALKIGLEELQPGQCEVSYLIPREYTKENLESLKKEISELNFILNNISEVATGTKEDFKVNSISSSDYLFYINVSLLVGNILVIATEKILNTYKNILEIKKLRNELKIQGVPDKDTKGIEEHANKIMETEIIDLAKEIVKSHYKEKDNARKNELISGLTISFNKIANRIDNGFNIDIRVESLPITKEGEEIDDESDKANLINSIKKSSKSLEFMNTSGKPILALNESEKNVEEVDKK